MASVCRYFECMFFPRAHGVYSWLHCICVNPASSQSHGKPRDAGNGSGPGPLVRCVGLAMVQRGHGCIPGCMGGGIPPVLGRSGCSHTSSSGGGHSLAGEMYAATERMPWQLPLGVPGPFGPAERRLCLISQSKWIGSARCGRGGSFPSPELKSQCTRGGLRG